MKTSDKVAPVVVVHKKDNRVRICGDLKISVNSAAHVEAHLIPRVEELRTKLSGGMKFSKLDLKDAYQHVAL